MHKPFGDYHIVAPLKADVTFLAEDATGRRLVLKRLPASCLRGGRLPDAIRQRLARLREVPVTRFAGPIGVEKLPAGVFVVSPYIAGTALCDAGETHRAIGMAAARAIASQLHRHGLAHGAVHAGNVIEHDGQATLIDASALLHEDFAADLNAGKAIGNSDAAAPPETTSITYSRPALIAALGLALLGIGGAVALAYFLRG